MVQRLFVVPTWAIPWGKAREISYRLRKCLNRNLVIAKYAVAARLVWRNLCFRLEPYIHVTTGGNNHHLRSTRIPKNADRRLFRCVRLASLAKKELIYHNYNMLTTCTITYSLYDYMNVVYDCIGNT